MKRNDEFLRIYRKPPRRAFSESLYKKLSGQKSFAEWLRRGAAWGVMVAMVVYGLSANLLTFNGVGLSTTPEAEIARSAAAHVEHQASIGERGLKPREFSPPAADEDWLGPFDRPRASMQAAGPRISVEMAVVIVPAVYR